MGTCKIRVISDALTLIFAYEIKELRRRMFMKSYCEEAVVRMKLYMLSHIEEDILLFLSLFFQMLSYGICQILGAGLLSIFIFGIAILLALLQSLFIIKNRMFSMSNSMKTNLFFSIILELVLAVTFGANLNAKFVSHILYISISYYLVIVFQLIQLMICIRKNCLYINLTRYHIFFIFVFFFLSFIMNLECLNNWPRWDTYTYYFLIDNLSLNNLFLSGKEGMVVAGHISGVFALYNIICDTILPVDLLNSMYVANFILQFIDAILFYNIIKRLVPDHERSFYLIATVACTMSPYIFGTSFVVNPEKLLMTSVLLFIYGILAKNNIISLVGAFIACNSKEIGVVIIAFMTAGCLLKDICVAKRNGNIKKLNLVYYICILAVGVLWITQFRSVNWAEEIKNDIQVTYPLLDGAPFNSFSFSILHIGDTLKGEFLTNFTWIFVALIFLGMIKYVLYLIHKRNVLRFSDIINKPIFILTLGFIGGELITLLFVTYHFYRYYTVNIAFVYLIGLIALDFLLRDYKLKEIFSKEIAGILAILLMIQCYTTIDIVSIYMLPQISTGTSTIVALPTHMQGFNDPGFTDAANYNRQIIYFDKAFDKALCSIVPSNDTKILLSDEYFLKNGLGSLYSIWGFGYQYVLPPRYGKFDLQKGYRYLETTKENQIDPDYITAEFDMEDYADYNEIYYISMPWGDETISKLINKYPKIQLFDIIYYKQWVLKIYKIK